MYTNTYITYIHVYKNIYLYIWIYVHTHIYTYEHMYNIYICTYLYIKLYINADESTHVKAQQIRGERREANLHKGGSLLRHALANEMIK